MSRLGRLAGMLLLALVAALPLWSYLGVETATAARVGVVALAVAAALFPASALLVLVGLLPVTGPLAALMRCSVHYGLGEPLVLAFLAGWLAGDALRPVRALGEARRAILAPMVVVAAAVAASAASQASSGWVPTPDSKGLALAALDFVRTDYFSDRGMFGAIPSAARVLEGLGLFAACLLIPGRVRPLGVRLLRVVVYAAAGIGTFSLLRLATVSLKQQDVWAALLHYVLTIRISAAFPDPNAAGSYLAMSLLLALGLALAQWSGNPEVGPRRPRWAARVPWLTAIGLVAAGLWLTGSRTALLGVVPAAFCLVPLARHVTKRLTRTGIAVVLAAAALSVPFVSGRLNPPVITGRSLHNTLTFRIETTRAAFRMVAAHPLFGVGVGRFHASSGWYFTPSFRAVVPRENAHNNFLQVLAELGITGFLPFVWLLVAVAAAIAWPWREDRLPAAAKGGTAGLLAFVLTWLTGHPLLIFEVATAFWVVLGTVAALAIDSAPAAEAPSHSRLRLWVVLLWVAGLAASLPIRGR